MLPLMLAYPVLVHFAVVMNEPRLTWLALVVLCAVSQYQALKTARLLNWMLFLSLAGVLYGLTNVGGGIYALYLPPILVPCVVLTPFASSLRPGQIPLVTRIAALGREALEPEVRTYTRKLTWMWAMLLAALALAALLLALFAPLRIWSLFTNFVDYLLVGLIFIGEYVFRRLRFPTHQHPGFIAYLRILARTNYKTV